MDIEIPLRCFDTRTASSGQNDNRLVACYSTFDDFTLKTWSVTMSQVRIYGHREPLSRNRDALSRTIHNCLMDAIGLPKSKRFQRFFHMASEDFIHADDCGENYTIIEISMFTGRATETKNRLIRLLFERIEAEVGIDPQDVEITIFESAPENWGIRGRCGDELALDYDVNV